MESSELLLPREKERERERERRGDGSYLACGKKEGKISLNFLKIVTKQKPLFAIADIIIYINKFLS